MQRTAQRPGARVRERGEDRRDEALHVRRAATVEPVFDAASAGTGRCSSFCPFDGDDIRVGGKQSAGLLRRTEYSMEVQTVGA